LNITVTKKLFEAFLGKAEYSDELKDALRSNLYEQTLVYPDGTEAEQANGQLMGSPLSFPILCAANLLGYVLAWEEYHGRPVGRLDKLPVLINGDDILFKANDRFYTIWQRIVKSIGFDLSVGKSYFDKRFCTVNSKLYCFRGDTGHPQLVTFHNPAQLLPSNWLKSDADRDTNSTKRDPFVGRLSDALERTVDPRFALRNFMRMNHREIQLATKHGLHNLFIPAKLGGIGVRLPNKLWNDEKLRITDHQRRLAHDCYHQGQQVSTAPSHHVHGFLQPCCATHVVKATVAPKPQACLPTLMNHVYVSNKHAQQWVYPKTKKRKVNDRRMMSMDDLSNAQMRDFHFWVDEIAPTDENNDLAIDIEFGKAIHMPFGEWTKGYSAESIVASNGCMRALDADGVAIAAH